MKKKITWLNRILKAEKTGFFTEADEDDSHLWPHCAVGERFKPSQLLVDSHLIGDIFSEKTVQLGLAFTRAIADNNFTVAKTIYKQIQKLDDSEMYLKNEKRRKKS